MNLNSISVKTPSSSREGAVFSRYEFCLEDSVFLNVQTHHLQAKNDSGQTRHLKGLKVVCLKFIASQPL